MSLENFIEWCIDNSISFNLENEDQVKVNAAPGKLTPEVISKIKHYKPQLIAWIAEQKSAVQEPYKVPNIAIPENCTRITPEMLPLVSLTQEEIDSIVSQVPNGAGNIKDIYPLAPLQEGMLFHHTLNEKADPYVSPTLLRLSSQDAFDRFLNAMDFIVDRYDVLRTAVFWRQRNTAVQVVLKKVTLPVEFLNVDSDTDVLAKMQGMCEQEHQSLDLERAPLIRLQVAKLEDSGEFLVFFKQHHMLIDHVAFEVIYHELSLYMEGKQHQLPSPVQYREFVAHVLNQNSKLDATSFFEEYIGTVTEPTIVLDLLEPHEDRSQVEDFKVRIDQDLSEKIKSACRLLHVNAASIFHAAWAMVVAKFVKKQDLVFGTVMSGRMQSGGGLSDMVGMTINTLPFRIDIQHRSAQDLILKSYQQLLQLFPYEQVALADAQRCSKVRADIPLFNTLLNYRHTDQQDMDDFDSMLGIEDLGGTERNNYPVTMSIDDYGDGYGLSAKTDKRLGGKRIIAYMEQALNSLLDDVQSQASTDVISLAVIPKLEHQRMIHDWNSNLSEEVELDPIPALFEKQVTSSLNDVALRQGSHELSYGELNIKVNRLAHYLLEMDISKGSCVGLLMDRSIELIIGLLAVLKSGAHYVPINSKQPSERKMSIVESSGVELLLLTESTVDDDVIAGVDILFMDEAVIDMNWLSEYETSNPALEVGPVCLDDTAYIVYTSGSTGTPKGVVVPHGGITEYCFDASQTYYQTNITGSFVMTSPSFDLTLPSLVLPLIKGGVVELGSSEDDILALWRQLLVIDTPRLVRITPSHIQLLKEAAGTNVCQIKHTFVIGGEILRPESVSIVKSIFPFSCVYNHYGPSEAVVGCTLFNTLELEDHRKEDLPLLSVPIGKKLPRAKTFVLADDLSPVPIGTIGELCVGRVYLSKGYYEQPDLTAEKFIDNPFHQPNEPKSPAKLYKTGDLVRWTADGLLEFVERADQQVKIRGFRIELGEVERVISQHPMISDSLVIALDSDQHENALVGYYKSEVKIEFDRLRQFVADRLPEYMTPTYFIQVASFPLSLNGKVDQSLLPRPDTSDLFADYIAPRDEIEHALCEIWQDILKVEQVGARDNFFTLGGHSLLATKLAARVSQKFEIEILFKDIYSQPILESQAANIANAQYIKTLEQQREQAMVKAKGVL